MLAYNGRSTVGLQLCIHPVYNRIVRRKSLQWPSCKRRLERHRHRREEWPGGLTRLGQPGPAVAEPVRQHHLTEAPISVPLRSGSKDSSWRSERAQSPSIPYPSAAQTEFKSKCGTKGLLRQTQIHRESTQTAEKVPRSLKGSKVSQTCISTGHRLQSTFAQDERNV